MKSISTYASRIHDGLLKTSKITSTWCASHMSERTLMYLTCICTGLLCGVCAWGLKYMIRLVSSWLITPLVHYDFNWILFAGPLVAIMVAGWLQRRVFRRNLTDGIDRLRGYLGRKDFNLPHQLMYQSLLGCSLTVGLGGSAGSVGPIVFTGAAIGSNGAKFLGLGIQNRRILIGVGAAAGLAGIFNAPVAGVLFTLEVLGMNFSSTAILGLVICCLLSAGVAYMLSGYTPAITWEHPVLSFDYSQIGWIILFGVIIGLYCKWYRYSGEGIVKALLNIDRPWLRNLMAGSMLGMFVALCPSLFGEGYDTLQHALAGHIADTVSFSILQRADAAWAVPAMLVMVLLLKGMAFYTTNYTGGISGTFAPSLFAGGMAGAFLSMGAHTLGCPLPPEQITYICMAGALAGIEGAPLLASFITVEATGTYSLLMPVTIISFITFFVAKQRQELHNYFLYFSVGQRL